MLKKEEAQPEMTPKIPLSGKIKYGSYAFGF